MEAPPPEGDPSAWSHSSLHDVYYRSPTSDELVDNEWVRADDIFVIPKQSALDDLEAGDASVAVALPLHDPEQSRPQESLEFASDTLAKFGTHTAVPFVERVPGGSHRKTVSPTFYFYVSTGFDVEQIETDDLILSAYATSTRASVAFRGVRADRQFRAYGPFKDNHIELELAFPTGKWQLWVLRTSYDPAPGALLPGGSGANLVRGEADGVNVTSQAEPQDAPVAQCDDGFDNDADGDADACDFSCVEHPDFGTDLVTHDVMWEFRKTVGLFGDMSFCTTHKKAYLAMFMEWAGTTTTMLNWVAPHDPPMGYDPDVKPPPFQFVMRGCVMASDVPEAENCDQNGVCPAWSTGYPWSGDSGSWSTIRNEVWELVNFTVDGGDVDDTHPIQIVVGVPMEFDGAQGEPGLANVLDGTDVAANGAALIRWDFESGQVNPGTTIAHEIGHTFGLAHNEVQVEGTSFDSFMRSSGGAGPVLDWELDSQVAAHTQGEVWQELAPSKWAPRPSGFQHEGCTDDTDCDAAPHLNLQCVFDHCQ